ncbi:hypothetical protein L9F63_016378, partial [Diploptera punctata]
FEAEFKAKKLNNWEVPKWYPDRPKQPRKVPTRIIANDRGHLLPGIQRVPGDSPWGNYVGTWDLPKKISRKLANEINKSRRSCLSTWERRSSHVPLTTPGMIISRKIPNGKEKGAAKTTETQGSPLSSANGTKQEIPISKNNLEMDKTTNEYTCTKFSKSFYRAKTTVQHDMISNNKRNSAPSSAGSQRSTENGNKKKSASPLPESQRPPTVKSSKSPTPVPPLAGAYSNFQIAKKLHRENLDHKPLPDTVQDSLYKCLQTNKLPHPGKSLNVGTPRVAAVGYRGYGASGPSQCSKLRVYRPKTAQEPEKTQNEEILPRRPSTAAHLSDMKLAICWDLKPEHEEDQPRPPRHIDGSNGSAAPAVFALVNQPQPHISANDNENDKNNAGPEIGSVFKTPPGKENNNNSRISSAKCSGNECNSHTNKNTADVCRVNSGKYSGNGCNTRPKGQTNNIPRIRSGKCSGNGCNTPPVKEVISYRNTSGKCSGNGCNTPPERKSNGNGFISFPKKDSDIRENGRTENRYNVPIFKNIRSKTECRHKKENRNPNMDRRHQSSPNLVFDQNAERRQMGSRPCMACELKNLHTECPPQPSYKMAFKAGKPSNSFDSGSNRPATAKQIRVPKPRAPFAKRSYSIDTLAPPFSLWPGHTGQDYPEHWRLASVYQHAYKPVETRRKPLLASVYQ